MEPGDRAVAHVQNGSDPTTRMRQSPVFAALLICEAFIAFGLGVFGNKVADLLKISTAAIIIGAALAILTLYLVTLARLRYEAGVRILPEIQGNSLKHSLVATGTTVFPVGMVCGLSISVLNVVFLPGRFERPFNRLVFHDYELVTFLIGVLLFLFMARRAKRKLVIFMYALGYSLGAAAIVQLMEPRTNNPAYTFTGTALFTVAASLIVSSGPVMHIVNSFEQTISASDGKGTKQ